MSVKLPGSTQKDADDDLLLAQNTVADANVQTSSPVVLSDPDFIQASPTAPNPTQHDVADGDSASPEIDHADDSSNGTPGSDVPFVNGEKHSGHLGISGQDDSYTIQLTAGTPFYLQLDGTSLADPDFRLDDPLHQVVDTTTAVTDDVITYTPTVTGAYTLHVTSASLAGQGDYTVNGGDGVVSFTNTSTHQSSKHIMANYAGPVTGLNDQETYLDADNVNMSTIRAGVFLRSGSGMDALQVTSGDNVLDGSTGSNFLVGGTGNDTFFLDDRDPTSPVFSTVVNFHSGDNVTVWGVNASDFDMIKLDDQGAVGFTGLDLIFSAPGHIDTSVVLAGYTSADLTNGRITSSYGRTPDLTGLPGSEYLSMHAN
jgi:hypothetical protein